MKNTEQPFRVDGWAKVTGTAPFAAEFSVPGMTHAVLVQSSIARGRIVSLDAARTRAARGVLLVLTHENRPPVKPPPKEFTDSFPAERRAPLEDDVVHYAGQHIAVVVAETLEEAQAAAALVEATYDEAVPLLTPSADQSYKPDHFATNAKEKLQYRRGDPEAARPSVNFAAEYQTPIEHHNPMEPSATLALWHGDRLMLVDSTRWLDGTRMIVAAMLGIAEDCVTVHCPFVGGAFGSKGFLWQHVVLAALAAKMIGRPVRQVLTRHQMFTSIGHRPSTRQSVALGAGVDGRLQSVSHTSLNGTSPVAHFVEPAAMSTRNLYRCENVEIAHRVAPINIATPCFMRAPGEAAGMFALESAMDELASELRTDPLELRLRNYAERDLEADKPWSSKRLRECYLDGANRFGWSNRPSEPRSMRRGNWLAGWGMATAAYPGRRSPSTVHGVLTREGEAIFSTATHELGDGTYTVMAQIAAEALGMPIDRVTFRLGDSRFPVSPVTGASQTTASVGSGVLATARELRRQLIELAVADPQSSVYGMEAASVNTLENLSSVLARMPDPLLEAELQAKQGDEKEQFTFCSFGAHFVEVLVDADTGEVRVPRWVGVFDVGRVVNERMARSQILGGILFGLGMALMEETVYDPRTGAPVNADLSEYLLPTSADSPDIDVSFIDAPDQRFNPLGVRGLGEIGVTGAPAAIANAVFHATGKRVRSLPIRPEKLLL